MNRITALLSLAAVAALSSVASAIPSFGNVSPTKSNGDFIPGTGIKADQFTIDTALTGESVALKARSRANGNPISRIGNRYVVPAGLTTTGTPRANWNFDFQFSPGANSTAAAGDYVYTLMTDIDPAFGATNFVTTNVPSSVVPNSTPMWDSYYGNGQGGSISSTTGAYSYNGPWSDATTPFVIANSQNYTFGFLAGSSFTNGSPGEYEIRFTATDALTNLPVASTTIFAVVPEPAALVAVAGGAILLLGRRRRRQA